MAGRILVLDDEENYAEMLQDLLRENNYRVDMATRPERAIAQLEEIPYDLVISDYKMPVMDGADFLKKARELYPNLPFILVSGLMNTPELVKVANMSVTLVMEKPLDTDAFLDHVSRFSDPMTEEEKEAIGQDEADALSELSHSNYPEEPRFFSANHLSAIRFMQQLWLIGKEGHELFIFDQEGGESEQAIKDLSVWRGNGDMLVDIIDLPENLADGVESLRAIMSDYEKSRVVGVRLPSLDLMSRAKKLTESVLREVEGSDSILLVFLVASASKGEFVGTVGHEGLVLPSIVSRPSDVAVYARRFARIAADRLSKPTCADFDPAAAYLILASEWPGGYKQIQQVIHAAVEATETGPITTDSLLATNGAFTTDVGAEHRISGLMKLSQGRYLIGQMEQLNLSAAELAKKLELDDSVQTKDDLIRMPLIREDLASF